MFFFYLSRDEREGPDSEGSYKYLYETANGINVEEEGYQKNKGTDEESSVSLNVNNIKRRATTPSDYLDKCFSTHASLATKYFDSLMEQCRRCWSATC